MREPEEEIRSRMEKAVKNHGLEKLMNRSIFKLSGGEKQKIACAGVPVMEPEVFVPDEPSSNLDAASILELREIHVLQMLLRTGETLRGN